MNDVLVVLCTVPDDATADRLARGLVEARLAACVNVLGDVRSVYRWEGEVTVDSERLLVCKTDRASMAELTAWLEREHPYTVPEVLALPVALGASRYLDWVVESLSR